MGRRLTHVGGGVGLLEESGFVLGWDFDLRRT
jgi:hypothetical protein